MPVRIDADKRRKNESGAWGELAPLKLVREEKGTVDWQEMVSVTSCDHKPVCRDLHTE